MKCYSLRIDPLRQLARERGISPRPKAIALALDLRYDTLRHAWNGAQIRRSVGLLAELTSYFGVTVEDLFDVVECRDDISA